MGYDFYKKQILFEIRPPLADGGLTSASFFPSDYQSYLFLKRGMELILIPVVGGRTSLYCDASELNQIPNMARSGFPACHCLSGKYSRQYRYNHYSG